MYRCPVCGCDNDEKARQCKACGGFLPSKDPYQAAFMPRAGGGKALPTVDTQETRKLRVHMYIWLGLNAAAALATACMFIPAILHIIGILSGITRLSSLREGDVPAVKRSLIWMRVMFGLGVCASAAFLLADVLAK